jgi:hypothetical protein
VAEGEGPKFKPQYAKKKKKKKKKERKNFGESYIIVILWVG